ncbi:MAG: SDR family NAD(P)-dependent oxidoreductase [Pseudomonadota bacterium]
MSRALEGKVVLVTGAGRGIGAAIARVCAREGARVALLDMQGPEAADETLAALAGLGAEVRFYQADVGDFHRAQEVVAEICETFGTLDVLVNNAGINRDGVIWKMSEESWDSVLTTDLKGVFNYTRAAAPVFRAQKSGRIINVSSINGLRGKFGQSNYTAAKAGVIGFSKSVARELGRSGVTVNVVCPGLIGTEMIESMPEAAREAALEEIVLGRMGTPEDVAEVIAFLASDKARHVTGEVIKVDGGQYI